MSQEFRQATKGTVISPPWVWGPLRKTQPRGMHHLTFPVTWRFLHFLVLVMSCAPSWNCQLQSPHLALWVTWLTLQCGAGFLGQAPQTREKLSRSCIAFYRLALEVTWQNFCYILVIEAVTKVPLSSREGDRERRLHIPVKESVNITVVQRAHGRGLRMLWPSL